MKNDISIEADEASLRLAAIVESCDDAIIGKTLDGVITSWNAAAEHAFGYTSAEAVGRHISFIVPPERSAEQRKILDAVKAGHHVRHLETIRVRKDGQHIEVSLTVSPIKDAHGRIVGVSKISRDITERKQAERELKAAKELAEAANRAKDEFLSVLSHELRTPLTPVLAAASALATDDAWPESLREDVEMIRRNVALEARLIDDLLDLTRLRRGAIELARETVDVHDALRAAVDMSRGEIAVKSQRLRLHLEASCHTTSGDPARLQQVFWSLLKNAVKFTPERGTITIRTRNEEPSDEATERRSDEGKGVPSPTSLRRSVASSLLIEISDTGVGIESHALRRIFEAFEQGDRSIARQFGGLGLGLAISKALVEIHGGTIEAFSEGLNKGATFAVKLPLRIGAGTSASSVEPHAPPSVHQEVSAEQTRARHASALRILLVEDHETSRRILARLLRGLGHEVTVAPNVDSALQAAAHARFDLLISDVGLPDGSGLDLMRSLHETQRIIKGICLSGLGMEEDQRRSREAGFIAHLTKPIAFQTLQAAIQRATHAEM